MGPEPEVPTEECLTKPSTPTRKTKGLSGIVSYSLRQAFQNLEHVGIQKSASQGSKRWTSGGGESTESFQIALRHWWTGQGGCCVL